MRRASVLFVGLALLACGGDDTADVTPSPTAAAATPTPPRASGSFPRLRLERVFPNLTFARMTGLHQAPDGRWFVVEQPGRILVFENRPDAQPRVFLDITDRVDDSGNEMGLLGPARTPDFAQSGRFSVNSPASPPRRTIVSRFRVAPGGGSADAASEFLVLEVGQPFPNHNGGPTTLGPGGQPSFGPDGMLYIGFGDGGAGNDPMGNGQNKGTLLGKLLRIDVSDLSGVSYAVPDGKPFVGAPGAVEEIWALGLRNPWRFSWDAQTGDLWLADVGQNAREEIDLVTKGGNYGWSGTEGGQGRARAPPRPP